MSFLRHGEIYPWDEGTISRPCPRPSPWMSFQPVIPGGLLSSRARVRFTSRRHSAEHPPQCQRNFIERYFVTVLVVSAQGSTAPVSSVVKKKIFFLLCVLRVSVVTDS